MDNESIRRYQIKEKIGAGGMGTVYRAWDRELERDVALKWLPAFFSADESFSERFKREIRVIAHLEHPHIVPIYDVGESDSRPYIIMRLLSGGTLRNRIEQGNFNLAALVKTTEQISDALAAAHARQIVHRDIKPGNILFDEHGSAFLSDFGIAKVLDSGTQLTGSGFIGTPAYMSPEQFTGQNIDGRSDQYSLAVVVYEALTGALPFEGNTAQMMYQHINVVPADIDLAEHPIPSGLNPVLLKALAKESSQRYARVNDFATAMAISMRMEPTTASVLLPVMVGTPPPGAARPPTAPTELDTPQEKVDTVAEDYRTGLEALALGKWAAAVAAFDRVLESSPEYGNAADFSRQARASLEQATAVDRTVVEPPVTPAETPVVEATMLEPPVAVAAAPPVSSGSGGQTTVPPTSAPAASLAPPQEATRRVPLWALGLALLLLLIITGYGLTQIVGRSSNREPSAAENTPAAAAVAAVATETPQAEDTVTSAPEPSATSPAAVADATVPADTPVAEPTEAQAQENTPAPIIQDPQTSPTETAAPSETATEEATEAPADQPVIVRVNVSSANLRRGPGTVYPIAGAILADEEAVVLATNRDGSWYNVELADGSRAWLAASVTETVDAAALENVPIAATIPVAPTATPRPPTPTRPRPTVPPPPPPTADSGGGGGSGGNDGGGGGGGEPEPPPKYTAEPP